jgi:hypothetical protein
VTFRSRVLSPAAAVWSAVLLALVARLLLLRLPAWSDEAGYLRIGGSWHLGGHPSSLYGDYWVDRPPVLVTLYGLAERLGGLTSLRLLGALAAALTILGVADFARTVAGPRLGARAAGWAAVTGAALLSTPYHWSFMVDGELLAVPFVAWGLALTARAATRDGRRSVLAGAAAGALGVAAFLTKQNFLDVFVFQGAFLGISWGSKATAPRRLLQLTASIAAGALAAVLCVAGWVLAHRTSLGDLWYAMYQFRLDAARGAAHVVSFQHLLQLSVAAALSGLLMVMVAGLVGLVGRDRRDSFVWALVVLLGYDVFSVGAGTNYWLHYLVQPTVAAAALLAILIVRGARLRVVPLVAGLMSALGVVVLVLTPPNTAEEAVGQAIGTVSLPGDAIITWPGRSNINYAAHLPSPYPYLWLLPAHTLDHGFRQLKALLRSSHRPTWFVAWNALPPRPAPNTLAAVVRHDYREVSAICGREIFLRSDTQRQTPTPTYRSDATATSRCRSVTAFPFPLHDLVHGVKDG